MVVIGDLHLQEKWIKRQQTERAIAWLKEQEPIKAASILVLLGDLFEVAYPSVDLVVFYFQLFKDWKDKTIYILEGNHDCNLETNALDFFKTFDNVKVIKTAQEIEIEGKKCLFLPHYDYENTDKEPMHIAYSAMSGTYDYIFAHVTDETQCFGGNLFCNLSNIKGQRLFGHVHSPDVQKGGSYLGSIIKNSSTEKDDQKYYAVIDDAGYHLMEVPSFMEYETVRYGDDVVCKDKLAFINVLDAPTKAEAEAYYETKFPNSRCNKVITKRQQMLSTEVVNTESEESNFETFCEEKQISEDVQDICKKVL